MAICLKCWNDAYLRSLSDTSKAQYDHYLDFLEECKGNPCKVSSPVRVRFYPKDTDETYDGTVIEENQYSYLVIPDDNLTRTARWNKKVCDIIQNK